MTSGSELLLVDGVWRLLAVGGDSREGAVGVEAVGLLGREGVATGADGVGAGAVGAGEVVAVCVVVVVTSSAGTVSLAAVTLSVVTVSLAATVVCLGV